MRALVRVMTATGIAFGVALIFLFLIALFPGVLVNEASVRLAASVLNMTLRPGAELTYSKMTVATHSRSALRKQILVSFDDICWKGGSTGHVCFQRTELGGEFDFSGFAPLVQEIGPTRILGGDVKYRVAQTQPERPEQHEPNDKSRWPLETLDQWIGFFDSARLAEMDFDVPKVVLQIGTASKQTVEASFSLQGAPQGGSPNGSAFRGKGELSLKGPPGNELFSEFRLASETAKIKGPWVWDLDTRLQANWKKLRGKGTFSSKGRYRPGRLESSITATASGFIPLIEQSGLKNCHFALSRTETKDAVEPSQDGLLRGQCVGFVELARARAGSNLPRRAELNATLTARVPFLLNPDGKADALIEAKLGSVLAPVVKATGGSTITLSGVPSRFPDNWTMRTDVDAGLEIPRFQRLVKSLAGTEWAIPSPMDVLAGNVKLEARGSLDLIKGGEIRVPLTSRLKSLHQRMYVDGLSSIGVSNKRRFELKVTSDVVLSDVRLSTPRMGLDVPLQFVPDQRIEAEELPRDQAQAAAEVAQVPKPIDWLSYHIRVRTRPERPLRVFSNLLQGPVPMHVDVSIRDDFPFSGSVNVEDIPVPVVGEAPGFERLRIDFEVPDPEVSRMQARVTIENPEDPITLLLPGRLGTPQNRPMGDPMPGALQLAISVVLGLSPELLAANTEVERVPGVGDDQRAPAIVAFRRRY